MAKRPRRIPWSHGPLQAGPQPLPDAVAHYLGHVLRLKAGAAVELFDGKGAVAEAVLTTTRTGLALAVSQVRHEPATRTNLSLAVALPKGERADWLVEKITELGMDELVWVACDRSVVAPHRMENKMERWGRLAEAAARQAGRNTLPALRPLTPLRDLFAEPRDGMLLVAHPHGKAVGPWPTTRPGTAEARVLIGPEGGLTEEELQRATAAGYTPWWLNRHILRIETAAVAAATLLTGWAHETERS